MCVFLYLVISTTGTPFLVQQTSFGKIIKSNLDKIWGFHSGVKKDSQKSGLSSNSGLGSTMRIMFGQCGPRMNFPHKFLMETPIWHLIKILTKMSFSQKYNNIFNNV